MSLSSEKPAKTSGLLFIIIFFIGFLSEVVAEQAAPKTKSSASQSKAVAQTCVFDGVTIKTAKKPRGGFQIRDVATGSDFLSFKRKTNSKNVADQEKSSNLCAEVMDLELTWQEQKTDKAVNFVEATLAIKNTSVPKDRAVTLIYAIPVSNRKLKWLEDARRSTPVVPDREYSLTSNTFAGNGRLSLYPLAAVAKERSGYAIGIDMLHPAIFRVAYNAATEELFLAYDIALTPEKPSAKVRFCHFTFEPTWEFRSALARYYELFPEYFRCRVKHQGLWMPFAPISKVKNWQDFGFMFKEGSDETRWDDQHGILTFRYTEPMTWWMEMPKEMSRTREAALDEAKKLAEEGNPSAKALFSSSMHDEKGNMAMKLRDRPWCNGALWFMNSMPGIQGDYTDFKNKWNPTILEKYYGKNRDGDLDGEYIDSSEGVSDDIVGELDFNRSHFSAANTPLTFSSTTHHPAIFRGLIAFEYIRAISADIHKLGKFIMANSTPYKLCWLIPIVDIAGIETDWNRNNAWQPTVDAKMLYRRSLCAQKPFCILMNSKFDKFTPELVEKYMKRALAYGMFPGFFSADASTNHYFSQPDLYERDRPLFKKYIPLCKLVAEAGWNPVTGARSSDSKVYVERFGRYLTVFNDSSQRRTTTISLDKKLTASTRELVGSKTISWTNGSATVSLDAEDVVVIELP